MSALILTCFYHGCMHFVFSIGNWAQPLSGFPCIVTIFVRSNLGPFLIWQISQRQACMHDRQ
ncbi:hypothetical protein NC652_035453 [Populus alba x Populus x berolinensis]|uniref:Uncharacterized protein n=1 Tax=Populus alba x Populus x berolinensis TaxID=444605 RepID=A0AAD6LPU4_9ROSI|nr:hypothetical protein NC652_035453 [Populus alba x Populus x berolinensis]KAJ6971055.1 hypothetical protein NC653_035356 [Populus alba x Populus x berolinensis]